MRKVRNYLSVLIVGILLLGTLLPAINGIGLQKQSFSEIKPSSISGKGNAVFTKDLSILNKKQDYNKKYAVIIVGSYGPKNKPNARNNSYSWFLNAAYNFAYNMLKNTYKYEDDDIYLLATVLLDNESFIEHAPKEVLMNLSLIDYSSTKKNISDVFDKFKLGGEHELKDNDFLFVCFIDHGYDPTFDLDGRWGKNTFFGLEGPNCTIVRLYDYEFASYMQGVDNGTRVFLLQPCFSGGFINELSGDNCIICTASTEKEVAPRCWVERFLDGLNGTADTAPIDGKISIREAYEYAAKGVYDDYLRELKNWLESPLNLTRLLPLLYPQHPLIDDNGDKVGHYFRNPLGYNPNHEGKDGYIADGIYMDCSRIR